MRCSFFNSFALATVMSLTAAVTANADQFTFFGDDDPSGTPPNLNLTNSNAAFDAFVATLSSYGVNNIDSIPGFTPDPTLTFGLTGISATTDVNFVGPFASLAVSGSNFLYDAGPGTPTGAAVNDTFTFNTPITAFGSYFSNVGDGGTADTLTLIFENTILGTSKSVLLGTFGPGRGAGSNAIFFFGYTDTDPFNKVTLVESYDYDGVLIDNVTAGYVAVPEVNSFALIAIAMVGVGTWRIRANRKTKCIT